MPSRTALWSRQFQAWMLSDYLDLQARAIKSTYAHDDVTQAHEIRESTAQAKRFTDKTITAFATKEPDTVICGLLVLHASMPPVSGPELLKSFEGLPRAQHHTDEFGASTAWLINRGSIRLLHSGHSPAGTHIQLIYVRNISGMCNVLKKLIADHPTGSWTRLLATFKAILNLVHSAGWEICSKVSFNAKQDWLERHDEAYWHSLLLLINPNTARVHDNAVTDAMLRKMLTTPGFDMAIPLTCGTWWVWTLPFDELFWVGTPDTSKGFCLAITDEDGEPIPSDERITGDEEPEAHQGEGASPTPSASAA